MSDSGINVQPVEATPLARTPSWSGHLTGGLSKLVAREIRAILTGQREVVAQLSPGAVERWRQLRARTDGLAAGDDVVWERSADNSREYYTFAGDLENDVLSLIADTRGVVARRARGRTLSGLALTSSQAISFPEAPIDLVAKTIGAHWRALGRWVQTGPYFSHLPIELRRREVLGQLGDQDLIRRLGQRREFVSLPGPVFV